MQRKIEFIMKFLITATFFVPLIVIPSTFIFPFIVPKIVIFRSLALLLLLVYVILAVGNWQKYKIKLTPINIVVGLFFLSFTISTFVGVDWYRSLWDNHERMLGLFTIFHYVIYYFVISSVVKEWRDWRWLLRLFLLAGSLVMLIGIWQSFVDPMALMNNGAKRVSATLGNSIYFSGYGLFLLAIGYLLAWREEEKVWKIMAFVGATLGGVGLFIGGTRGTLVGLLVGLVILGISYAISLKEYKKIRQGLIIVMAAGFILLGVLFVFRQTHFVKNIPALGNLLNTSITSGTANTRIMAWSIAVEAWGSKPIFGWGPNNFYYAFNQYYRPEFLENGWNETWFDNAHNIVMNTLTVQGSFGIIIYFALFSTSIWMLWRAYFKNKIDAHTVSLCTAFLVAHFVHNIFVFENPTSYLYFFFFLAFVNMSTDFNLEKEETNKIKLDNFKFSMPVAVSVTFVVLLFIYSTNINPARANMTSFLAIKALYSGVDPIEFYNQAASIPSPHIDDIRNDFSRTAGERINQVLKKGANKETEALFELAYKELQKNRALHPLDIRVHLQQANLAQIGLQITKDPRFLVEAEKVLLDALDKSPKRQQIEYFLSVIEMQMGKIDQAAKILRKSIDNDPNISEGWERLIVLYFDTNNESEANELIQEAAVHNIIWEAGYWDKFKQITSSPTK